MTGPSPAAPDADGLLAGDRPAPGTVELAAVTLAILKRGYKLRQ